MIREDVLKEYILSKYKSLRAFALSIGMSTSTIDNVLKRGMGNSSVSTMIDICQALNIDLDELYLNSEIVEKPIREVDRFMPIAAHDNNSNLEDLQKDIDEL